ncbi:MAG: MoxR family ATPase [Lachnospiraceae bacterium]|nr:MoxR family ATPase [Lachnospiraceae bacterium]
MQANELSQNILSEIKKIIQGKDQVIQMTICAILAGGHVLLEDIPGVGKTTLAMSLARALALDYRRMQFTPDVLPSDLIGFNLYDKTSETFRFEKGAVYTNLFLADEINRTSPKTQSALLEVMEEGKATVEGVTRELPKPFFVIATQNPFGSSGTQKLPESQLDRFMVCLTMGYPDRDSAIDILKNSVRKDYNAINCVCSVEELGKMQQTVENLYVDDSIYEYIMALTELTRNQEFFALGLSPRGSIALLKMAKAMAFTKGRDFVIPEDVMDVFLSVASHRVKLSPKQKASGQDLTDLLLKVLKEAPIPHLS